MTVLNLLGGSSTYIWDNNDGLHIQYGTQKAQAEVGGEFKSYGQERNVEFLIDLTKVTSTAQIVSNTEFLPANPTGTQFLFIESVEIETLVGMTVGASATGISIGIVSAVDRTTVPASGGTALVNALANASFTTTGQKITLTTGVTSAGGYIGAPSTNFTYPVNLTVVDNAGTYSAGLIKVRVKYYMYGTIAQ